MTLEPSIGVAKTQEANAKCLSSIPPRSALAGRNLVTTWKRTKSTEKHYNKKKTAMIVKQAASSDDDIEDHENDYSSQQCLRSIHSYSLPYAHDL